MSDWNTLVPGCVTPEGIATINCIPAVIKLFIQSLLLFAGIVAVFLIVHSGSKFVLSSGDPKRVEEARNTLVYAVMGLIIVMAAFLIVNLVSHLTGVECIRFEEFNISIGFECK
ncbi:MAG: hypothetical protein A3D74_00865 [Candidatus Levybacteria bacterium RIFCSPHIGHO2_02_FULL_37_13]|nr:MAG: hypothetical protein A3D74_00865 [Candidatus Levybacteria bacterium RIFCSPHIGHO2_02_FULL_37_13]OGH39696.1 MAG: hypothetical protein A3B41_04605 [Candidatus Levybacteria bacterium RIFCSPLOWO2_01_FULL_37_26]